MSEDAIITIIIITGAIVLFATKIITIDLVVLLSAIIPLQLNSSGNLKLTIKNKITISN